MPERNRGQQPNDHQSFAPKWYPIVKEAVDDFCYLLTRGYADNSVLEIVGNRYQLNKRQRNAIRRIACSDQEAAGRKEKRIAPADLKNKEIEIDGFNLLILLESALSGAFIFKGRDGTYRDISSVHGSYKRVNQTQKAIVMVGNYLKSHEVQSVKWYLDKPVSNSGRLKTLMLDISETHGFNWEVELHFNPDKVLAESEAVVVTTDGWILDRADEWCNLGAELVQEIGGEVITV